MKKVLVAVMAGVLVGSMFMAGQVQAKEKGGGGPAVISFFLPGVGEWINSDQEGSYPFGECIVGALCFPFMISSVIDAAGGATDRDMRFEFWSAPKK